MLTLKTKNKYENYKPSKGTINVMIDESDQCNKTRQEEINLKMMIEKYGIQPFELLNSAKEPLYLNEIGTELSYNERMKQSKQIQEYFEQLPAKVRKAYNDDYKVLETKLAVGDYSLAKEMKIIDEAEQIKLEQARTEKQQKINELQSLLAEIQGGNNESNNEKED